MDALETGEREELIALLERRLAVIGNHTLRDADPDAHLTQLKEVSEAIMARHTALGARLSPRLEHFLGNCSYDKALAWLREGKG